VELTHLNGAGRGDEHLREEDDDPEAGLLTHAAGPGMAGGAFCTFAGLLLACGSLRLCDSHWQ
jgi:hypothetical protein